MTGTVRSVLKVVLVPALLLAGWWIISAGSTNPFWPPLRSIIEAFPTTWTAEAWMMDVLPSIGRLLLGYCLAAVVGVALGYVIGTSPVLRAFCEPTLEFLRAIPPPIMLPVIALFLGYTNVFGKILTIVLGCVWPILLNTIDGVRSVEDGVVDTARSFRFRRRTQVLEVVLPAAAPRIFAGLRLSLAIGVVLMVISEMFAADRGLGSAIIQFQETFAIPQMWTGILLLGMVGVVLSLGLRLIENRTLAWYHGQRRLERGA